MNLESAIILATLITNIVGFAYTWFREARQHKWAIEELTHNRHVANGNAQVISNKVDISTRAAVEAYKEANDLNLKIKGLLQEIAFLHGELDRRHRPDTIPVPNPGVKDEP